MAPEAPQADYNILFLGESKSGKSTSIESLKKYADQRYTINKDNLGDGIFSKTSAVSTFDIHTNLPSYYITDNQDVRVDYGAFLDKPHDDYEHELNDRRSYRLNRDELTTHPVSFRLIDSPGLNDTALNDEANIATIFKALENIKSIHLVVITVANNNPFTEGLRDALQTYVNLLPELNGNIVFLHTRIDYSKMHPDDKVLSGYIAEKQRILHDLMGRDTVPHILIDNDIDSKRIIRNCITHNTLRNLLDMAKLNQPIRVRLMMMNKTEKMLVVDNVLRQKCLENIRTREATLRGKDREVKEVLARIGDLKARIAEHEQTLQDIKRDLAFYDVDSLELHHEDLLQQGTSLLGLVKPITMYFPGKTRAETEGFIRHSFDHIDILERNVKILQSVGGVGHSFWAVRFCNRKKRQYVQYHVKIYITKRKKFSKKIDYWKTAENKNKGLLQSCTIELAELEQQEQERRAQIDVLSVQLKRDHYLLGKVSTTDIDSNVFHDLVAANGYVRDIAQSAINVENYYVNNKDRLDKMAKVVDVDNIPPVNTSSTINEKSREVDSDPTSLNSCEAADFDSKVIAITNEVGGLSVGQNIDADGDMKMDG